jgi:heterodisulfide reductase subunit A2
MKKNIVTIGGGLAGIEVSNLLAEYGHNVTVVEKEEDIGGKLNLWDHLFPNMRSANDIRQYLHEKSITKGITILNQTEVTSVDKKDKSFVIQLNPDKKIDADAIVIASGFDFFKAEKKEEYGYGIYDNVITSVDLEKMLREDGKITMPDGKEPRRMAFIHCVGSRDAKSGNHYCSKVCCVTGVKQAIEINELMPGVEIFCFYMDLRMYGLEWEEIYKKAQEQHHIQFIRGRLSEASENIDHSILIKAEDTLSGRPLKMNVDMVVLLVGMEAGRNTQKVGEICGLEQNKHGFLASGDVHIGRNLSTQNGIFLAGSCSCPMSIADTIEHARSAAIEVHKYLTN